MVNDYNTKEPSLPWLVMYSNSGDIGILDILAVKQAECATTGIVDFFVPLEVTRLAIAATNTIDTLTCSSGVGAKSPSDKWIAPGAKVWFTGTANGRVWLYIDEN